MRINYPMPFNLWVKPSSCEISEFIFSNDIRGNLIIRWDNSYSKLRVCFCPFAARLTLAVLHLPFCYTFDECCIPFCVMEGPFLILEVLASTNKKSRKKSLPMT